MALTKYSNIDQINTRQTNTGQFLSESDRFVVSQFVSESVSFGTCNNDVMEVTVYDSNNNILRTKDNQVVTYIKYPEITDYFLKTDTNELAIDVEKILNKVGFTNGILKININFVRTAAGNETEYRKFYIQQISPTRREIRVLPLNVQTSTEITNQNKADLENLQELNVDYKTYRDYITDTLNKSYTTISSSVDTYLNERYKSAGGTATIEKILVEDFLLQTNLTSLMNLVYSKVKANVVNKLNELPTTTCDTISSKTLDNQMIGIITGSVRTELLSKLATRGTFKNKYTPAYITGVDNNADGQPDYYIFETPDEYNFNAGKNVKSGPRITETVTEYTQASYTDVQLNAANIDNFTQIQQQVLNKLSPTYQNTQLPIRGTTTSNTTTDTGTTDTAGNVTNTTTNTTTTDTGTTTPTTTPTTTTTKQTTTTIQISPISTTKGEAVINTTYDGGGALDSSMSSANIATTESRPDFGR